MILLSVVVSYTLSLSFCLTFLLLLCILLFRAGDVGYAETPTLSATCGTDGTFNEILCAAQECTAKGDVANSNMAAADSITGTTTAEVTIVSFHIDYSMFYDSSAFHILRYYYISLLSWSIVCLLFFLALLCSFHRRAILDTRVVVLQLAKPQVILQALQVLIVFQIHVSQRMLHTVTSLTQARLLETLVTL